MFTFSKCTILVCRSALAAAAPLVEEVVDDVVVVDCCESNKTVQFVDGLKNSKEASFLSFDGSVAIHAGNSFLSLYYVVPASVRVLDLITFLGVFCSVLWVICFFQGEMILAGYDVPLYC